MSNKLLTAMVLAVCGAASGGEAPKPAAGAAPPKAAPAKAAPAPAAAKPPDSGSVSSATKASMSLYGTLVMNAFFNTAPTNNIDVPLFALKQGSDPAGSQTFGMTARQSRIGMRFQGREIGGAKLTGQVEVDFLGGKPAFGNGQNMDLIRLRIAVGRLDWKTYSLVAGEDWSVFAPLNPSTLAEFAIPGMSASGNAWIRSPQIRFESRHDLGDSTKVQLQIAATDPSLGDYPTAQFRTARTPGIGEYGRVPASDGRLLLTHRGWAFGFSGHYARGQNSGTLAGAAVRNSVDSLGMAFDYTIPVGRKVMLAGEMFRGRALGIFSAAAGQSVLPVGTPGARGVMATGGWSQLQYNPRTKWQFNLVWGMEADRRSTLTAGSRHLNRTYMGNIMYKPAPPVTFGLEYRRFLTDWLQQPLASERGDHVNLAVAFAF